jgi:hypothetical protein
MASNDKTKLGGVNEKEKRELTCIDCPGYQAIISQGQPN